MNRNYSSEVPPMGWNSYDYYDTTVNEAQIRANADYMASHLKAYGWEYIVVDIQWYAHGAGSMRQQFQYIPFSRLEIDEYSRLLPDPERFPSSAGGEGFGPLAAYIHKLGLKFGIHIMRGIPRIAAHLHMPVLASEDVTADAIADPSSICGWNPDMYGVRNTDAGQAYYDSLLKLYASWGVDFIKCDDICNTNLYPERPFSARHEIEMLSKAVRNCGRPMVLSLSPGPALIDKAWHYEQNANMWRITDDFWDNWDSLKHMFTRCELWQSHVAAGCYPDCDMLPLGRLGKGFGEERQTQFTRQEQRTMMTLWCIFGSPLILGAELTELDEWTLSLLTNERVLAMLSPSFRPRQIRLTETEAVWTAYRENDASIYTALFNLSDQSAAITVTLPELGINMESKTVFDDLWEGDTGIVRNQELCAELPPHGCALFLIQWQGQE